MDKAREAGDLAAFERAVQEIAPPGPDIQIVPSKPAPRMAAVRSWLIAKRRPDLVEALAAKGWGAALAGDNIDRGVLFAHLAAWGAPGRQALGALADAGVQAFDLLRPKGLSGRVPHDQAMVRHGLLRRNPLFAACCAPGLASSERFHAASWLIERLAKQKGPAAGKSQALAEFASKAIGTKGRMASLAEAAILKSPAAMARAERAHACPAPFEACVRAGRIDLARAIHAADPAAAIAGCRWQDGDSPIEAAAFDAMLGMGADPDGIDHFGQPALAGIARAAFGSDCKPAQAQAWAAMGAAAVRHGASMDKVDGYGRSSLSLALGDAIPFETLSRAFGARPCSLLAPVKDPSQAMHRNAIDADTQLELLLRYGAGWHGMDDSALAALARIAAAGLPNPSIDAEATRGAAPERAPDAIASAAQAACQCDHPECFEALLESSKERGWSIPAEALAFDDDRTCAGFGRRWTDMDDDALESWRLCLAAAQRHGMDFNADGASDLVEAALEHHRQSCADASAPTNHFRRAEALINAGTPAADTIATLLDRWAQTSPSHVHLLATLMGPALAHSEQAALRALPLASGARAAAPSIRI